MRLTESQLRRIIKEEIESMINESDESVMISIPLSKLRSIVDDLQRDKSDLTTPGIRALEQLEQMLDEQRRKELAVQYPMGKWGTTPSPNNTRRR